MERYYNLKIRPVDNGFILSYDEEVFDDKNPLKNCVNYYNKEKIYTIEQAGQAMADMRGLFEGSIKEFDKDSPAEEAQEKAVMNGNGGGNGMVYKNG